MVGSVLLEMGNVFYYKILMEVYEVFIIGCKFNLGFLFLFYLCFMNLFVIVMLKEYWVVLLVLLCVEYLIVVVFFENWFLGVGLDFVVLKNYY